MTSDERLHELAALVADMAETIAGMSEQIRQLQNQPRPEPAAPPQINVAAPAPVVQVSVPAGPAPVVNVAGASAGNAVIECEWEYGRLVRLHVRRVTNG